MLRRLSSKFQGRKREDSHGKGMVNGDSKGTSHALVNNDRKRASLAVQNPDQPDYSVTPGDIQSNFEKFAHLLQTSNRPLPTQGGEGSDLEEGQPSGFLQDLKTFGFKDINTMLQVMKGKATGELQEYVPVLPLYPIESPPSFSSGVYLHSDSCFTAVSYISPHWFGLRNLQWSIGCDCAYVRGDLSSGLRSHVNQKLNLDHAVVTKRTQWNISCSLSLVCHPILSCESI